MLVGDAFSQPQHSHYGHRNIVTQPVVTSAPPPRLLELLDFVKQEFENVHNDVQHFKSQNQEFEGHSALLRMPSYKNGDSRRIPVSNHIGELGQLREQYFALEREHHKVKAQCVTSSVLGAHYLLKQSLAGMKRRSDDSTTN